MTPLSQCSLACHSIRILRPKMALCTLSILMLFSALAFAQTYLQFRIRDLQIETRKLQSKRSDLENDRTTLTAEVEKLKCLDETVIASLGLEETMPGQSGKVMLRAESIERWNELSRATRLREPIAEPSSARVIAQLGERVLSWSTPLMARDAAGE